MFKKYCFALNFQAIKCQREMKPCKSKIFSLYFSAPQNFLQNTSIVAHIYSNLGVSYSIYIFSASQWLLNSFIENLVADMLKGYKKTTILTRVPLVLPRKQTSICQRKLCSTQEFICVSRRKWTKTASAPKLKPGGQTFFN